MSKMSVTVNRSKATPGPVKGPVVLTYLVGPEGKKQKVVRSVAFGESFEVEAQVAYEIAAKYPGLVHLADSTPKVEKSFERAPSNKMIKDEATK